MPYAFVAAGAAAPAQVGNTRTLSATFAAGETVLVVAMGYSGGPASIPLQIADGVNTWTEVARVQSGSGSETGFAIVWKADGVAAGTVTLTLSRTDSAFTGDEFNFFRYTGLASGAVLASGGRAVNPSGTGGSNNVTGTALTPGSQPAMLFAACWPQNEGTQPTAGSGGIDRGQLNPVSPRGRVEDLRLTSLAAVTPSFTTTNTFEDHQIIGVVIAEAAGAPPQFSRPSSDVSNTGWTASNGSDLFAMLDETSAGDTDYISTAGAGSVCVIGMQAATDPGVSVGHVVRYRLRGDGSAGVQVELLQNTTVIAAWTHDPAPTTYTNYSQTLTGPQADSISNYGALRLRFTEV